MSPPPRGADIYDTNGSGIARFAPDGPPTEGYGLGAGPAGPGTEAFGFDPAAAGFDPAATVGAEPPVVPTVAWPLAAPAAGAGQPAEDGWPWYQHGELPFKGSPLGNGEVFRDDPSAGADPYTGADPYAGADPFAEDAVGAGGRRRGNHRDRRPTGAAFGIGMLGVLVLVVAGIALTATSGSKAASAPAPVVTAPWLGSSPPAAPPTASATPSLTLTPTAAALPTSTPVAAVTAAPKTVGPASPAATPTSRVAPIPTPSCQPLPRHLSRSQRRRLERQSRVPFCPL